MTPVARPDAPVPKVRVRAIRRCIGFGVLLLLFSAPQCIGLPLSPRASGGIVHDRSHLKDVVEPIGRLREVQDARGLRTTGAVGDRTVRVQ